MKTFRLIAASLTALAIASLSAAQSVTMGTPVPQQPVTGQPGYIGALPAPVVISTTPGNGQTTVNPNVTEIRITFNLPMDAATFYWPVPQNNNEFPYVTRDPYWTNGTKTIVLPVRLAPAKLYTIPLNVSNVIFRSAQGAPLQPGYLRFRTTAGGSAAPMSMFGKKELPTGVGTAANAAQQGGIPTNTINRQYVPNAAAASSGGTNSAALQKRTNSASQSSINKAKQFRNTKPTPTPIP